jgi:hypothetical protein
MCLDSAGEAEHAHAFRAVCRIDVVPGTRAAVCADMDILVCLTVEHLSAEQRPKLAVAPNDVVSCPDTLVIDGR